MPVVNIKSKVLSGLKWNTFSLIVSRGTDFIVNLILARLLMPDSYGVVGMAQIIIGFLTVISDMGLFNALIQKKDDELIEARYSTVFWYLLIIASFFVCCFFLFISPAGASFYNEPRLVPVLNALSFYLFFNILSIIPRVILTKQLDFRSLVQITYLGSILSSVVAIAFAFLDFGVWSLVVKSIVSSSIIFFSYWIKVGWRPKFVFKRSILTELSGYSFYTQVNAILFYFRNNLDYLIIGKLVNAHILGVYTLAFTLTETLRAQLYSIFNKVFFPVYSKIQDDKEQIKEYYLKVMRLTVIVTFPVSILFIGLSEEIIVTFFGQKWIEAVVPLRILAVASMIFAISGTPAEVLKSIGKASVSFYLSLFNTILVAFPLVYFGLKSFGLAGVGYAICVHYTISRVTFHYYMKKHIGITDGEVFNTLKKPVLAAALMLTTIYLITLLNLPLIPNLIIASMSGCVAYSALLTEDIKKGVKLLMKKQKIVLRFGFKSFRKPSFICHYRSRTYKLFSPKGKASKIVELLGNQNAITTNFWSNHLIKVKPGRFYLSMDKGKPVALDSSKKAEQFIESKLQEVLSYPRQTFNEAFDFNSLRQLENYGLKAGLLEKAEDILKTVSLPITSAHGDLHVRNMVCIGNEIKIIDWSMFANKGSFITDFIHYYNYKYAVKNKESWTEAILKEHPFLYLLANEFETTPLHLRLAYAISRIWGETIQLSDFSQIPKKTIAKYNFVLNRIIDEFVGTSV